MKKFATILVLLFVLSVSTFADGVIHIGNRNCPQGQTCLTDGGIRTRRNRTDYPQSQTDLTDGDISIGGLMEDSIIGNVFYFLKSIF